LYVIKRYAEKTLTYSRYFYCLVGLYVQSVSASGMQKLFRLLCCWRTFEAEINFAIP